MKHNANRSLGHRFFAFSACLAFLAASTGCGRKQQDTAKAAESAVSTSPAALPPAYESAPEGAPAANESEQLPAAPADAAAPAEPKVAEPVTTEKRRKESAAAASRATKGAGAATPSKASAKDLLAEDDSGAEPAYAEPPEMAQALKEFDSQLQALSTTRACDEACRAFESMKRTAQRICELVLDADPKERCRTARGRLEQASRDLTTRCPECR